MENIKDKMTTIAGYLGAIAFIGGTIIASIASNGIAIPLFIIVIIGACGAASVGIIGYYNGKTPDGKTKTPDQVASQNAPTGNVIKTVALLIGLSLICNFSQAQTKPFKGFFKPKSAIQMPTTTTLKKGVITVSETSTFVWKFRPAVFITADAIKVSGGIAITQPLSSIGTGVSYAKFIDNDGIPYEQFNVSALVMTNINLNGTSLTSIGGGLIVGAFNGYVNLGAAYIGNQVYVLLGTKINL